jgi:hypothetical protein
VLLSRAWANRLAEGSADDIEDLLDVAIRVALLRGAPDATLDVILEDQEGDGIDGRSKGRCLLQDVDAVLLALDHALYAPDLALDAPQTADQHRLIAGIGVPE